MTAPSTHPIIPVVILVDLEPDALFFKRAADTSWRGCEQAFITLNEWRSKLARSSGRPVHFTWLVRADEQIAKSFGSPAWILQQYRKQFAQLRQEGDEIGLHVHAYRWEDALENWVEDYANQAWVEHCVRMGVDAYQQEVGHTPKLFSMGHEWMNQATVQLIEQLGIACDVTTVAGQPAHGFPTFLGAYTGQCPDYSMVPLQPYQPSEQDFRIPAQANHSDGLWMLPLASHCVIPRRSLRQKLAQFVRNPLAAPLPPQIEKVYLSGIPQELGLFLEKLGGSSELGYDPTFSAMGAEKVGKYVTLITRANAFSNWTLSRSVRQCLELLSTHPLAPHFSFVTPLETLQLLVEPKHS